MNGKLVLLVLVVVMLLVLVTGCINPCKEELITCRNECFEQFQTFGTPVNSCLQACQIGYNVCSK